VSGWPLAAWVAVVAAAAFVEHVFPPLPGDSVVVAGAVELAARGHDPLPVLIAATVGGAAGATLDWWLGGRAAPSVERLGPRARWVVAWLVAAFRRHGAALLLINRFVPGVRALFFVAAGIAELPLGAVLGWSTLSSVAWNALLVALGAWVGWQFEDITGALARTVAALWGGGAVIASAWWLWSRASR